ncbi:MAG: hypothetical protein FWC86_02435 [Coriobacteriia bacterium]|nr:hypothetical protein [Coriobacteriia bacterium]
MNAAKSKQEIGFLMLFAHRSAVPAVALCVLIAVSLIMAFALLLPSAYAAFPEAKLQTLHAEIGHEKSALKRGTLNDSVDASSTAVPYTLFADNFVLHIDDFFDADVPVLANAVVHDEEGPSDKFIPVVKESGLRRAIGSYEVTLTVEATLTAEGDDPLKASDLLAEDSDDDYSDETSTYPTVTINVFVVDDNTTVEDGIVFYAHNFRMLFSDKTTLCAQSVMDKAYARAYHIESGIALTDEINVDEQELADFIECQTANGCTLSLSVPATPAVSARQSYQDTKDLEEAVNLEVSPGIAELPEQVMTTISINVLDDRPPVVQVPNMPVLPTPPPSSPNPSTPSPALGSDVDAASNNAGNSNVGTVLQAPTLNRVPASTLTTPVVSASTTVTASNESSPTASSDESTSVASASEDDVLPATAAITAEPDGSGIAPPPIAAPTQEPLVVEGEGSSGINLLLIAGIVVVVVLLGLGSFLLYQHFNKDENKELVASVV